MPTRHTVSSLRAAAVDQYTEYALELLTKPAARVAFLRRERAAARKEAREYSGPGTYRPFITPERALWDAIRHAKRHLNRR